MAEDNKELSFHIDILQKIITRTDGFHNYANTKSTILITFITACFVAIFTNYKNAIEALGSSQYPCLIVFFKIGITITLIMLMCAFYFAGKTVIPYLKPSDRKNIYSFVDAVHFYKTEQDYCSGIMTSPKTDIIESMASLQYNLSKGLIEKYKNHRKSIFFIIASIIMLTLNIALVFIA
ncbi:hypothetical protein Q7I37_04660 [Aeromonas allosaccharophila]|uniref:hypothetical protein n=1 Tax=Aeromonas allosaccharophila TaxID=656 RepID=UPI0030066CE9